MNTIDLLKQLRTLAYENGEDMSLRTAKNILKFLIDNGLVEKDSGSYGELVVKVGTPVVSKS